MDLDGKTILVTGATGSFGTQFMRTVLDRYEPHSIRVFSRDELKQSQLIETFDAFVLVTPEYNHSTSAALKNALDHLHREWRDKPVAFVGYGLDGGTRAVEHLRAIVAELGMAAVGPQVAISLRADYAGGRLEPRSFQPEARKRMLDQLARWATALRALRSRTTSPQGQSRPVLGDPSARAGAAGAVERLVAGLQDGVDRASADVYDRQFASDVLWGSPLPGVAIAHVRRNDLSDDKDKRFSEMAMYVLVERGGQWWLAAGQNTPVAERPA